jgi:hypothetical protein
MADKPTKITDLEGLPKVFEVEVEVVATEKKWSDRSGCENMEVGQFCACGAGKAPSNDGGEDRSCRHYHWNNPNTPSMKPHDINKVTCEDGSTPVAWKEGFRTGFYCEARGVWMHIFPKK